MLIYAHLSEERDLYIRNRPRMIKKIKYNNALN